jgi:pimeloyl-ACP methyl ester carboxylesterase
MENGPGTSELPEVAGVRHDWVDARSATGLLRVHVAKAGSGDPVLLLHGWPQHWYEWRFLVPLLAPHRRLLMPDLRGFGWTTAPGRGYDPETLAADAVALLDALELECVLLVGHDWGGYAALLAGLRHPERFTRLLVLNTPVPWSRPSPALLRQPLMSWYAAVNASPGLGRWTLERGPRWVGLMLRAGLVRTEAFSAEDLLVFARAMRSPEAARASQLLYRAYHREFFNVLVRRAYDALRLTIPTRMLWGENDAFIHRGLADGWRRHADDMVVESVPDCGHFIAEEKPELVAGRILAPPQ